MTPDQEHRHASDIRNALTTIKGHAQIMQRHLRRPDPPDASVHILRLKQIEFEVDAIIQHVENWLRR